MNNNESAHVVPKRKRGRPRKERSQEKEIIKRGRGRPRKYKEMDNNPKVKRCRGRPRKYHIMEKELGQEKRVVAKSNKVDSGYLLKKLMDYFTAALVVHNEMSQHEGGKGEVFKRLKSLDFQMIEVCKTILSREYEVA